MKKRNIILSVIAVIAVIIVVCCVYCFRYYFVGTSSAPVDAKENADFGIADICSSVDRDGDGVDDQTDILQGARDYIASQPVYKNKYYSPG